MCHVCLATLGFFDIKWTIDPVGQLPPGVEPGSQQLVLHVHVFEVSTCMQWFCSIPT